MSDRLSPAYLRSREQQERAIAETATDPAVAAIHLDLARRYSSLAANTTVVEQLAL